MSAERTETVRPSGQLHQANSALDVLSSYHNLNNEASELALRNFLSAFKTNAAQIQDAVDTLTPSLIQQHEGDEALSKLGKEFFLSLEDSLKACGEQRDKAVCKIEELKQELEQSFEILNSLKKERKEKGNMSKGDCSKSEAESTEGIGSLDHDQELSVITSHHIGHQKKHSSSKEREMSDSQSLGQKQGQKSRSLTRNKITKDPQRPPWQD
ncbi:uncharacterized protein LOC128646918 [Bombina bombina]|uniref:uncharacterized protein LOC128646918 n=1 Tax=Bombina bombina TaxID=8345 RepID=UPI00235A8B3C|nr:uncharacterized protein LOC128646918 [Bombina bombina]